MPDRRLTPGLLALACLVASGCGRVAYDHTRGPIGSGDGGTCSMDAACDAGVDARPALCGDGVLAAGETCDDGNGADGDGCENDCSFTCEVDGQCDDEEPCNGVETCMGHVCRNGASLPDGEPCGGGGRTCRAGACAAPGCGDAAVGPGELCDDGNTIPGDGCENDCTFSCEPGGMCPDDGDECTGAAACSPEHRCETSPPLELGDACDRDDNPMTIDLCLEAGCVPSRCGDRYVVATEECDDGNMENGDGCEADCTITRDAGPSDGGTHDGAAPDGGLFPGECWRGEDCEPGETCCPADPPCPGQCWPGPVCPLIKCIPADSGTS